MLIVNFVYWNVVVIVMISLMIVSGFGLILLNRILEIGDMISMIIVFGNSKRFDCSVVKLIKFCR